MGINYNPRTVTDGLVLALDAGNAKSYPGSGTTWSDLSGNGNNGTFTNGPGYSGAAIQFDGTGDYLTVPNSSAFDFSTGDLTIEAWVYIAGNSNADPNGNRSAAICATWSNTIPISGWAFIIGGNTTTTGTSLQLASWGGANNATREIANVNITQQTWHHLAVSVSNGTRRLFLNGALLLSNPAPIGSGYNPIESFGNDLRVGATGNFTGGYVFNLDGYISNLRITKGVARYTSNFTPPTAPFPSNSTDDSDYNDVSLLLYGTDLEDTSPTPKTITVNGDTNVNNNVGNPFSLVRSIDFDGTDDAVILGDILDDVTCGPDKKFSISVWVKYNSLVDNGNTLVSKIGAGNYSENQRQYWLMVRNPSNAFGSQQLEFAAYFDLGLNSYAGYRTVGATIETGKWYNFVISYDGSIDNAGRYSLFIDGVSYPITTSFTAGSLGDIQNGNARLAIGAQVGENVSNSPTFVTDGKIANVSIYNKALTPAEIKQNFNALRGRFGI